MIIVSNTSPINYLILIGQINLLPELFQQIIIPQAVYTELSDKFAPQPVQTWIRNPPSWLKIQPVSQSVDAMSTTGYAYANLLDPGESEAILLAQELNADLLILDDMKARRIAKDRGLVITGILGILDQAATMKLIDLPVAIQNLKDTSFWAADSLYQKLLDKYS
jgi:predicted nucleic acid-binding protein